MKALKILGIAALAILLVLLVIIMVQPEQVHVEKSIVINGTADAINAEVESFQSFNAWSPWNKNDNEARYTIVTFKDFGGTFYSDIKLEPDANGTKVTWIYDGYNKGLKSKAMWVLMKGNLNEQYDIGLQTLKRIVEAKSAALPDSVGIE